MKRILSITAVICFVFVAVQAQKNITLEDIFKNNTFASKYVAGFNFMKDGKYYTETDAGNLLKKEVKTGVIAATIVNAEDLVFEGTPVKLQDYTFSADEKRLLIRTESESIFRRSSKARVFVYDIASKKIWQVGKDKILHATLNAKASQVAYVKDDNNLYLFDLASNKETAITTDGEKNKIINGNCDWVYEEEFSFSRAFEWNSDGSALAYYKFDESNVPEYSMPVYGKLYPSNNTFKYPKAGEDNSFVSIWSYQVSTNQSRRLFATKDYMEYIPRIRFAPYAKTLVIINLNRHQNETKWYAVNIENGDVRKFYEEQSRTYIDINDNTVFLKDGNTMIYSSEKDGWEHIYIRNVQTGTETCLTPGDFDIEDVKGVDEKEKRLYYTAAEWSPMDRQLFCVDFNGKNKKQLTRGPGIHRVTLNTDYTLFTDNHSNINTPSRIQLCDIKGDVVKVLEDNQTLKDVMKTFSLSQAEFLTINGLNAWMIKPTQFDSAKKYPVLMYVYGGPGSQTVTNGWMGSNFFWYQMLAEKGYIIISVDNTGTGFRGERFKKKTYLELGRYESDDQIEAARTIGTWKFVDAARIGIWGWSYGGFMSSTCITKGADVFKTAIAVAPVTNWRYYDNIYTERYMRTPAENASGYDENSPVNMVSKLKGNYLIIHGTGDDNVHFQNTVMMVDAMIAQGKVFDSEFYPNKNHSISGGNTRYQLYNKMTSFLLEKL